MQVKTYCDKTSAHCLTRIKAELGPDAIILSNKTINKNGTRMIEVMAAIEDEAKPQNAQSPKTSKDDFLTGALDSVSPLTHEWEEIKGCLLQFMRSQRTPEKLAPPQRVAMEYLEREGVDEKVLTRIYAELCEDSKRSILPILEGLAKAKPLEKKAWQNKLHAFAGPGGVGKTSVMIRWALREKKENPNIRIALACADSGRGQGRLILRHYADIASLAFREVVSKEDFVRLVAESRDFDLVLIDLPSLHKDENLTQYLTKMGMAQSSELSIHLVLAPHFHTRQYDNFMNKYMHNKIASILWTKLDEACTFGSLLNVACSTGLPFSALSYGSGLKNSMDPANNQMVWRLLFKHQLPGEYARQGAQQQ